VKARGQQEMSLQQCAAFFKQSEDFVSSHTFRQPVSWISARTYPVATAPGTVPAPFASHSVQYRER
jgi:hypothetical protein